MDRGLNDEDELGVDRCATCKRRRAIDAAAGHAALGEECNATTPEMVTFHDLLE